MAWRNPERYYKYVYICFSMWQLLLVEWAKVSRTTVTGKINKGNIQGVKQLGEYWPGTFFSFSTYACLIIIKEKIGFMRERKLNLSTQFVAYSSFCRVWQGSFRAHLFKISVLFQLNIKTKLTKIYDFLNSCAEFFDSLFASQRCYRGGLFPLAFPNIFFIVIWTSERDPGG